MCVCAHPNLRMLSATLAMFSSVNLRGLFAEGRTSDSNTADGIGVTFFAGFFGIALIISGEAPAVFAKTEFALVFAVFCAFRSGAVGGGFLNRRVSKSFPADVERNRKFIAARV